MNEEVNSERRLENGKIFMVFLRRRNYSMNLFTTVTNISTRTCNSFIN